MHVLRSVLAIALQREVLPEINVSGSFHHESRSSLAKKHDDHST